MRILFCDDNPDILNQLQDYVAEYFAHIGGFMPEYEAYTSSEQLLEKESLADIVFLDVEMPGLSGIHVGAELKKRNPSCKIFIVTSYPDYLDEAMRFQVFRYLSKPIDKNRLFRNLKDAIYQHTMETREYPVITETGMVVLRADEILCVEATQRKCFLHTTRGIYVSNETMEYWKKTLSLVVYTDFAFDAGIMSFGTRCIDTVLAMDYNMAIKTQRRASNEDQKSLQNISYQKRRKGAGPKRC